MAEVTVAEARPASDGKSAEAKSITARGRTAPETLPSQAPSPDAAPLDASPSDTPPTAPLPAYLRKRHAAWKATGYDDNRVWFQNLAAEGQRPRAMVVSCCDSRVNVVEVFGGEPGDLFVVRNVASLVPPHAPDHAHHGTSAAVEYAVTGLKVVHIVVTGHSGCGGVKACHEMCSGNAPELAEGPSYVGRWMDLLRPGYDRVAARVSDPAERLAALEREAVVTSLRNLMSFPFVAEAVKAGRLTLHGTFVDLSSGALLVYDHRTDSFS